MRTAHRHIYKTADKTPQYQFLRQPLCQFQPNQNKNDKNKQLTDSKITNMINVEGKAWPCTWGLIGPMVNNHPKNHTCQSTKCKPSTPLGGWIIIFAQVWPEPKKFCERGLFSQNIGEKPYPLSSHQPHCSKDDSPHCSKYRQIRIPSWKPGQKYHSL